MNIKFSQYPELRSSRFCVKLFIPNLISTLVIHSLESTVKPVLGGHSKIDKDLNDQW